MKNTSKSNGLKRSSVPESSTLEYKESVSSRTYLKTVSAFANYQNGEIKFGIADNGDILGIPDPEQAALDLENQINDNIKPRPHYNISIDSDSCVITVKVLKGKNVPYRYKDKSYRRNGTSTVEVDDYELNQLILRGNNLEFCDLPSNIQDLHFSIFSSYWNTLYSLPVNQDLLATLGSFEADEYSNTAELLADENSFPGISVVQFGKNVSQIEARFDIENNSVLKIFDDTIQTITNLISYEEIAGIYRELKTKVPIIALRETLVNAIVHRDWSIPAPVQVEIYPDKLTILSPGGLPKSMSEEEYLYSNRSIPRNTQLTIVFLRLNLIEKLGTGLRRVRKEYEPCLKKPVFTVFPNSILVELPFVNSNDSLNEDQALIIRLLQQNSPLKRKQMQEQSGFSQSKITRILRDLLLSGIIEKANSGPKTEYRLRQNS